MYFATFDDFWPFYLSQHRSRRNRRLHLVGTTVALGLVGAAVARKQKGLLLAALVAGYAPAWIGHATLEHNTPATFKHPLWSLRADMRMSALALTGQLDAELKRLGLVDLEQIIAMD